MCGAKRGKCVLLVSIGLDSWGKGKEIYLELNGRELHFLCFLILHCPISPRTRPTALLHGAPSRRPCARVQCRLVSRRRLFRRRGPGVARRDARYGRVVCVGRRRNGCRFGRVAQPRSRRRSGRHGRTVGVLCGAGRLENRGESRLRAAERFLCSQTRLSQTQVTRAVRLRGVVHAAQRGVGAGVGVSAGCVHGHFFVLDAGMAVGLGLRMWERSGRAWACSDERGGMERRPAGCLDRA